MAKKAREEVNADGWKDTYGDLVTLLLCFFVLLYSMSSVSSEKWEAFVKALSNPGADTSQIVMVPSDEPGDHLVGGDGGDSPVIDPVDEFPVNFDQLLQSLEKFVEENNMQDVVELDGEQGVVYIRFQNSLFFRPNEAVLLPDSYPSLEFLGECLKRVEDQIWMISISGHTAHVPGTGSGGVNEWLLSSERAGRVAIYLEDHAGLDPMLLRAIGFGRNYPIESNDTDAGRARNRRVEMVIISNDSAIAQNETLASAISGLYEHGGTVDDTPAPDDLLDLLDPSRMGVGAGSDTGTPAGSAPPQGDTAPAGGETPESGTPAGDDLLDQASRPAGN